ncbi:class I SAM-dependent methyltransferase [Candidatus Woesearchaeota archaeon]|nr:class I SAM-dependent methyltransferase [Candidatus Woesearchaeota archaeon]
MANRLAWNLDALVYDFFAGQVDQQLYQDILKALGPTDGMIVDDLGCGTGNLTRLFSGTTTVRAIDLSPVAIAKTYYRTGPNVYLCSMDFYNMPPSLRPSPAPHRIVASRSLYHPDLPRSIGLLASHLRDDGIAVVAHAVPNVSQYMFPRMNGTKSFSPRQAVKAAARLSRLVGVDYRFFEAEEFERAGRQHFDAVNVELGGFGTHYVVRLQKGNLLSHQH